MGSKRGSQTEFARAGCAAQAPAADLGHQRHDRQLEQAARHALGIEGEPVIVGGAPARATQIRSIFPTVLTASPASGAAHVRRTVARLNPGISTLLLTNTRNQSSVGTSACASPVRRWRTPWPSTTAPSTAVNGRIEAAVKTGTIAGGAQAPGSRR